MNLVERAQSLSRQIAELESLNQRAGQASLFEKRANDWSMPTAELQKLESTVKVIVNHAIPVPFLDTDIGLISILNERINNLSKRYKEDKSTILDPFPGEDVRFFLNQPLNSLPSRVKASLLSAWVAWSKINVPEIDGEILNVLNEVPSLRDSVAVVNRLKIRVGEVCSSLPTGDGDIEELERLCSEIADKWHNLAGDGIPSDVLMFLRAAGGREGARLNSITQEVLNWLAEHSIQDSLRIWMR